jgi:uncharacterized membrane protein
MSDELKPENPQTVQPPLGAQGPEKPVEIENVGTGADFSNNYQKIADAAGKQMNEAADALRKGELTRNAFVDPTADSDDRLVAFLCYVVPVLLPIIVLLSESSQKRSYQRFHAIQSLGLSGFIVVIALAVTIVTGVLQVIPILGWAVGALMLCLSPILFLMAVVAVVYYGIQAYQGKRFEIPVVTNFLVNQGWL